MKKNILFIGLLSAGLTYTFAQSYPGTNPDNFSTAESPVKATSEAPPQKSAPKPASAANSDKGSSLKKASNTEKVKAPVTSSNTNNKSAFKKAKESPKSSAPTADSPKAKTPAPAKNTSSDAPTAKADSDDNASVSAGGVTASESGLNAGSMSISNYTIAGTNYQRLSWRPELVFGKLGIAWDLELILADGEMSSEGWNFDTQEDILNTLYRKIYYIRWDQPGAPLYAKLGALEGITLDAGGLITNGWGNTALYPKRKDLGVHLQINETITPFKMGFEFVNNALQDWSNNGGVIGGKFSFTPVGNAPVLGDLRIGISGMGDLNQYAALADSDGDDCPDLLDDAPNSNTKCVDLVDNGRLGSEDVTPDVVENIETLVQPFEEQSSQKIKDEFKKGNDFYLMAIDAYLPLLKGDFFSLSLHAEYARPVGDQPDLIQESWAAIPLGFNAKAFIFRFGADYLQLDKAFQIGHFDANYDKFRAQVYDKEIKTKADLYWNQDLGFRQGIFGRLGADLWAIDLSGSYTHLITNKSEVKDDISFTAKLAVAPKILEMIPKISKAEIFYNKDRIGQDYYKDADGNEKSDSFWEKSIYTVAGTSVGIEMSAGMELIWTTFYTWDRDENGNIIAKDKEFLMETTVSF
jgi:hypothetical protein